MKRRVVITGAGAVTPLGIGVEPSWQALCEGRSGIVPVTLFDPTPFKCQLAGEVKGFVPLDFMDEKTARRMDRFIQFAVAAARMAVGDSGLKIDAGNEERVGTVIGTGMGTYHSFEQAHALVMQGAHDQVSPFFMVTTCPNMAAAIVSILFHARGPQHCPVEACSTGTNALGLAFRLIQIGEADAFIAGGTDAGIVETFFAGLDATGATTRNNKEPQRASRPFDATRDGFVTSEGAGILVLEELGHALGRGAKIYAEVVGWGHNCDAYHYTSPAPDGSGPARCMTMALRDAGLGPEEVDYINAHGTSTKANDVSETRAIKRAFGEHARKLAVSSNKSMLGHMWGAAGAVEAIFSALTIRDGIIPPTINYEHPDPQCDLDYVPNVARKARVRVVLSNSFGFGGINGSLILRAFEG